MPIRNTWSLQPGECITAEEIMDKTGCEAFFPLRDVGIDLLVVRGQKHVGVQVKESRYYSSLVEHGKAATKVTAGIKYIKENSSETRIEWISTFS